MSFGNLNKLRENDTLTGGLSNLERGRTTATDRSVWLPVSADEIEWLIIDEESMDDWERPRRIRQWVRRKSGPRATNGQ